MKQTKYLLVKSVKNRSIILNRYSDREMGEWDLEWIKQFETKTGKRNYKIVTVVRA